MFKVNRQDASGTAESAAAIGLGDVCAHCGRRCRVPVSRQMPDGVRAAYDKARLDSMATCEEGVLAEHRLLGASYADVIVQRILRVNEADAPRSARELLDEMARMVQRNRERVMREAARTDQVLARSRDALDRARELSRGPDGAA